MRALVVFAILGLIYVLVRYGLEVELGLDRVNPVLIGYGALFAAGIVAAELLRPLLGMMSALSRFVTVAVLAGLVWVGLETARNAGYIPETLSDPEIAARPVPQTLLPRAWDGVYRGVAQINNMSVGVVVSTGTPVVVVQYEEAERIDLFPETLTFSDRVTVGDRKVAAAPVMLLSVRIDGVEVFGVPGAVAAKGAIETSIIGLSFLDRLGAVGLSGGKMLLRQ
jgi:clan AA aspartic protease (TIGR02281 family)